MSNSQQQFITDELSQLQREIISKTHKIFYSSVLIISILNYKLKEVNYGLSNPEPKLLESICFLPLIISISTQVVLVLEMIDNQVSNLPLV